MGIWGGTTMTERRRILPLDGFATRHENQQVAREPREHARKVEEVIELFQETFDARRDAKAGRRSPLRIERSAPEGRREGRLVKG
jgi:hypothetical protein